jgi:hypothetical protein
MNSEEYSMECKTIEAGTAFEICEEHGNTLREYYTDNPMESQTGWVCTKTLFAWLGY